MAISVGVSKKDKDKWFETESDSEAVEQLNTHYFNHNIWLRKMKRNFFSLNLAWLYFHHIHPSPGIMRGLGAQVGYGNNTRRVCWGTPNMTLTSWSCEAGTGHRPEGKFKGDSDRFKNNHGLQEMAALKVLFVVL